MTNNICILISPWAILFFNLFQIMLLAVHNYFLNFFSKTFTNIYQQFRLFLKSSFNLRIHFWLFLNRDPFICQHFLLFSKGLFNNYQHFSTHSKTSLFKKLSLSFSPLGQFFLSYVFSENLVRKSQFSNLFVSDRFCIKFSEALKTEQSGQTRVCRLKTCYISTNSWHFPKMNNTFDRWSGIFPYMIEMRYRWSANGYL